MLVSGDVLLYPYRMTLMMAVLVIMLASGYAFDLRYLLSERAAMMEREAELKRVLQLENTSETTAEAGDAQLEGLSLMLDFMQRSAMTPLEMTRVVSAEDMKQNQYQFNLQVNYQQLLWLVTYLQLSQSQIQTQKFLLSVGDGRHLKIEMLVDFDGEFGVVARMPEQLKLPRDPFCYGDARLRAGENNSSHYALKDLQFLGMSVVDRKPAAVMLFPDGRVMDISLLSEVGKERGKLVTVTVSAATVALPDHSQVTIKRFLPDVENENK